MITNTKPLEAKAYADGLLERLRTLAADQGIPIQALARAAGVAESTLHKRKGGACALSTYTLAKLLQHLRVDDMRWLLVGESEASEDASLTDVPEDW